MIKLNPEVNLAIEYWADAINLFFSYLPDAEIVDAIYSLDENPGVTLNHSARNPRLGIDNVATSEEKCRTYYHLKLDPIHNVQTVATTIARYFHEEHRLTVKLMNVGTSFKPEIRILKPSAEETY